MKTYRLKKLISSILFFIFFSHITGVFAGEDSSESFLVADGSHRTSSNLTLDTRALNSSDEVTKLITKYKERENKLKIRAIQAEQLILDGPISLDLYPAKFWPISRPSTAIKARLSWFDAEFDMFLWVENDEYWAEVVPISGEPFVCGAGFSVKQDGLVYDDIKLERVTGSSLCGYITENEIIKLTQWSFVTELVDFSLKFTLLFSSDDVDTVEIQIFSIISSAPTGISASDGTSSNYVTVRWNSVSGATSYDITRCTTTAVTSCNATARGKTGTSYNAGSGAADTTYYYRVRACNNNGCSAWSDYDTGY